jgi:hypothetical protein
MQNNILNFKPKYSVICLIYKSVERLDFVYNQVIKHTPLNDTEFFFVANDATDEVLDYLENNYIPHYKFSSTKEQQKEWYINNVYRGYNYWVQKAKWEFVILINSDMTFSHNWLENLYSKYNGKNCIASRLVELWRFRSGIYGIEKNFWGEFHQYKENDFLEYAEALKEPWISKNGWLYMPLLINRKAFLDVWWYPEGNIIKWSDIFQPKIAKKWEDMIFWDAVLMEKLKTKWIYHMTSFDSIVYHFQAWELSYNTLKNNWKKTNICIYNDSITWMMWEKVLWNYLVEWLPWNTYGIDKKVVWEKWNFEKKANKYIKNKYPNTHIIIQNATFISKMENNIPTIAYLQDDLKKMWRNYTLQKENLDKTSLIITNSEYTSESYWEYESEIIPIWLNESLFSVKDKKSLRKKYSIPAWNVGIFVWSLSETKWWEEIKKLVKNTKEVNYWIIVTKHKESFQEKNTSLYSKVNQEQLSELLNCADFFIVGSKIETQCLAALEAALCDIPLVMRNIWIFKNFSKEEKSKLWVFTDNLEDGIKTLLKDKKKYTPRKIIIDKWLTIENMITKWKTLLQRFIMLEKQKEFFGDKKVIKKNYLYTLELLFRKKLLKPIWIEWLSFSNFLKISFYKDATCFILRKIKKWK